MGKQIDIATSNATPPAGVACYGYTYGGHKFLKKTELAGENPETRLYLGGAEFVEGQPESYYHGEGRVALTGSEPRFQYKLTDHLGNTMVLFEDKDDDKIITTESMSTDPALVEVLQRNFYYAFGLPMQGPWNHAPADPDMPYLYNGKELEGELGLGWYAYGFRYYDASVGRFAGVDPLAGEMPDWSPFGYAYSNPISFIDFMGLAPEWIDNGDGTYTAEAGDSAWSLHKKTGESFQKTNALVQSQYGPNYTGADGIEKSNINPGDVVRVSGAKKSTDKLPSSTNAIDFTASDQEFFQQTLKIAKGYSLENKLEGGDYLESGKYNVGDFLRNAPKRDGLLNYLGGDTDGYGYSTFRRSVNIDGNQIDITLSIIKGDKMTLTQSYFSRGIVVRGFQHINGGFSKHISIEFPDTKLRDFYLNNINGN